MNIREFSYNLQKLNEEITDTFSSFQSSTGWNCLSSCGRYQERPGLCRMFGVSGFRDKNHQVHISICKFIKDQYETTHIPEKINQNEIHIMTNWSSKISTLDHGLDHKKLPINLALLGALEKVAFYMQYQEPDSSQ